MSAVGRRSDLLCKRCEATRHLSDSCIYATRALDAVATLGLEKLLLDESSEDAEGSEPGRIPLELWQAACRVSSGGPQALCECIASTAHEQRCEWTKSTPVSSVRTAAAFIESIEVCMPLLGWGEQASIVKLDWKSAMCSCGYITPPGSHSGDSQVGVLWPN